MSELFITVVGGLLVIILASWLGLGGPKVTIQHGQKARKTGKWIILISVAMILGGLAWAGSNSPIQGGFDFGKTGTVYGLTLAGYGVLLLIVGKIIAWFQRP